MTADKRGTPRWFLGVVLVLSLPFYALGITATALPFAPALPISALMACVPMVAALGLVAWQSGAHAARALFASAFHVHNIPNARWALVALAIMPLCFAVTSGVVWRSGAATPSLQLLSASAIIPAFALFFLGAVGEEIGWQGYAFPALADRHSALMSALIIGVVWALWHVVPFALMGRSAAWIIWQGLGMVLMRIIIVWLFVNSGHSILIAVLFHMMSNSVWGMFPDFDPYYSPMVMFFVLLVPVIVILSFWGQSSLWRFRS